MKDGRKFIPLLLASLVWLAALLSGCSFSLAEDIPPPPGYQPPEPLAPTAAEVALPMVAPDPAQGKAIFNEKCAPCHGVNGSGDGVQAGGLPVAVPAIGAPELARQARPVDWFNVITYGRMERFMPPFYNSLTDRQRWDVVAYLYTLSTTPEALRQGKAIYTEKCQSCHGPQGRGDGPQAGGGLAGDWSNPTYLARRSAQDIWEAIRAGKAPAMPAFAGELSEDQGWAVAAYIRTFGFAGGQASGVAGVPATGQEAPVEQKSDAAAQKSAGRSEPQAANQRTTTIAGKVINGSGGDLPDGLVVKLQGFDAIGSDTAPKPAIEATAAVLEDGSYRFADVEVIPQRVFLLSVEYQGYIFNSEVLHGSDIQATGEQYLPVTVYNTSTDASPLVATRVHIFLDFSSPEMLSVVAVFIISNPAKYLIVAKDGTEPVLRFELPKEALNLQFMDGTLGGRFVQTENGFGDRMSIPPGPDQHQVTFGFQLPYHDQQQVRLKMPLPVEAVVVAVPNIGIHLQSAQLQSIGNRTVQGVEFLLYNSSRLLAGSELSFALIGRLGASGAGISVPLGSPASLAAGLGALTMVLAAGGLWLLRRRGGAAGARQIGRQAPGRAVPPARAAPEKGAETAESLLDAIVALDDLYRAGKLSPEAYRLRRAELKEKLRSILTKGKEAG